SLLMSDADCFIASWTLAWPAMTLWTPVTNAFWTSAHCWIGGVARAYVSCSANGASCGSLNRASCSADLRDGNTPILSVMSAIFVGWAIKLTRVQAASAFFAPFGITQFQPPSGPEICWRLMVGWAPHLRLGAFCLRFGRMYWPVSCIASLPATNSPSICSVLAVSAMSGATLY